MVSSLEKRNLSFLGCEAPACRSFKHLELYLSHHKFLKAIHARVGRVAMPRTHTEADNDQAVWVPCAPLACRRLDRSQC